MNLSTVKKFLNFAEKEIGTKESPANSNIVKYNDWFYGKNYNGAESPWCAVFVAYCFINSGANAFTPYDKEYLRKIYAEGARNWEKIGEKIPIGSAVPGDIIMMDMTGNGGTPNHIGICVSFDFKTKTYTTIEGNTTTGTTGNQSNGGIVAKRTRPEKYVVKISRIRERDEPSDFAKLGVEWAKNLNISTGERPKSPITREEMITILYNFAHTKV